MTWQPRNDVIEKWVKALESGEYKQGIGKLHRNNEFCCLGVLCDLYIKEHPHKNWKELENSEDVDDLIYDYAEPDRIYVLDQKGNILPPSVCEWAGLSCSNPSVMYNGYHCTLTELNDKQTLDFKEIAECIRESLPEENGNV